MHLHVHGLGISCSSCNCLGKGCMQQGLWEVRCVVTPLSRCALASSYSACRATRVASLCKHVSACRELLKVTC